MLSLPPASLLAWNSNIFLKHFTKIAFLKNSDLCDAYDLFDLGGFIPAY